MGNLSLPSKRFKEDVLRSNSRVTVVASPRRMMSLAVAVADRPLPDLKLEPLESGVRVPDGVLDECSLLIVEVEGSESEMEDMLQSIVEIARRHAVKTVRESQSAMEAALIWKGRKSAFGATGRIADYICMDGTVPLSQLSHVLNRTAEIVNSYGLRVANVFHAGDGNMHPLILFNANDPEDAARAEAAGNDILRLCVDAGGCLTGEHGVGIEKRDLMRYQYSETDLAQQMAVRAAFDPDWILNPSKVFPLDGRNAA